MQEILFTPSRNDLQEKKNQLQCNNHMDLQPTTELQAGGVIKPRRVHN